MELKFGFVLSAFSSGRDRFCTEGYGRGATTLGEAITMAKKVSKLNGIELVTNSHVNENNLQEVKSMVTDAGLDVCTVIAEIYKQPKWAMGSFTSNDPQIRKSAISEVKKAIDWANALHCKTLDLWFGQDGYDYAFQIDYARAWDRIVEGVAECADYDRSMKICIEYKMKEPRTHMLIGTAAEALLLINEVNRENVGVLLDIGHSLAAYENMAEIVALLNRGRKKKLFSLHLNDNYRYWDDDLVVGSVHTIELTELLYWLRKTNYTGWYVLDIHPYREDKVAAVNESIAWVEALAAVIERLDEEGIEQALAGADAMKSQKIIREAIFRG
jgi:xylose isomerase